MTEDAPLTWEEKAALGCLGLMSLQAVHELVFGRSCGMANMAPASMLLVVLVLPVVHGVMKRHRNVWWWGAFLLACVGLALLAGCWRPIREGFGLDQGTSSNLGVTS